MFKLLLTILFLTSTVSGQQDTGFVPELGQFPWIAVITAHHREYFYKCSGAFISKDWILTVALFCGNNFPLSYSVQYGKVDFTINELISDIPVENFIMHPEYFHFTNNIALLKLPYSVEFSEFLNVINLPDMDIGNMAGVTALYSGTVSNERNYYKINH